MKTFDSPKQTWAKITRLCTNIAHQDRRHRHRKDCSRNAINLGNFYVKGPQLHGGWAYLEDGSIYVQAPINLSHENFEGRMKLIQSTWRSTKKKTIFYQLLHPQFHDPGASIQPVFFKRIHSAKDMASPAFNMGTIDPSGRLNVGKKLELFDPVMIPLFARALGQFRGTLIDGTLQPNVRLGNGLRLQQRNPFTVISCAPTEDQARAPVATEEEVLDTSGTRKPSPYPSNRGRGTTTLDPILDEPSQSRTQRPITEKKEAPLQLETPHLNHQTMLVKERASALKLEKENIVLRNQNTKAKVRKPLATPKRPKAQSSKRDAFVNNSRQEPTEQDEYDPFAFLKANTVPESLQRLNKDVRRVRLPSAAMFSD